MKIRPFISGEKTAYVAVVEEDFTERLRRWRNDPDVTRHLFQGVLPSTADELKAEYEQLINSPNDVVLAMLDKETGTRIGVTGYYDINWIARHGELRTVIGEKEFWGKGYGTEMMEVMIAFGFSRLNLNKMRSGVNANNTAAIRYHSRLKIQQEGLFRQYQYRDGKFIDAAMFGVLRDEFIAVMKERHGDAWSLETAYNVREPRQT